MGPNAFPFLWGAATSSHQVEGGNDGNDWWDWEQTGKVPDASGSACAHFKLFPQDFEIIRKLGHTAHRFSIEWSRIQPGAGLWDQSAIEHYREALLLLNRLGIEPIVTLHHFTNPRWFTRKGGWENPESVHLFTAYVRRMVEEFGSLARFWITINEPVVYTFYGYLTGTWPPGKQDWKSAATVFRHQLLAHQHAYRAIHLHYERSEQRDARVSVAHHIVHMSAYRSRSVLDRLTTKLRSWMVNDLFLEAAQKGHLFFPGLFSEFLPADRCLDFIGVNYYTRHFVRFPEKEGDLASCEVSHEYGKRDTGTRTQMGWEVYPEGLYRELQRLARFKLPILICENGIAAEDDRQRADYIRDHLEVVQRARTEGVPVAGYLYWSLLDNFEWAEGFRPRFGIVEIDYATQERKIRPSAHVLTDLCRKISRT